MLDKNKERVKILSLIKRAEEVAGENHDIQHLCIINYLNIGESQLAERLLTSLINENYNVFLNVILFYFYI